MRRHPALVAGAVAFALTPAGQLLIALALAPFNHDARKWIRNGCRWWR